MGRIEQLLKDLCPQGAPIMRLGQIGTFTRGNGLQRCWVHSLWSSIYILWYLYLFHEVICQA